MKIFLIIFFNFLDSDEIEEIYMQNLVKRKITSYDDSIKILSEGLQRRNTASTTRNDGSSRSHAIFSVYISGSQISNRQLTKKDSVFHFIDLAGSESLEEIGNNINRQRESSNIVKSLYYLKRVITLISEKKNSLPIPYRSSKLTYFLCNSLGGNCKVIYKNLKLN